jgi:limonene-1,2-epoxide hydrolase
MSLASAHRLPASVAGFLDAMNARDADSAGSCFTEDISYHLIVPYPAVTGREAVVAALAKSLTEADRVRWEVVSWSASDEYVFVERVDRFWYGDREATIECTGVFVLRDGLIAAVRDYADLATWRERKKAATAGG